jgi:hypothetical protein
MGQKPFEKGEWVWSWDRNKWFKIAFISRPGEDGALAEDKSNYASYVSVTRVSRDPHAEIPPKPKRMVRKEAKQFKVTSYLDGVAELTFHVPYGGKNVHCTYEVPED